MCTFDFFLILNLKNEFSRTAEFSGSYWLELAILTFLTFVALTVTFTHACTNLASPVITRTCRLRFVDY